jgi:hypothetical protein
VPVLRRASAVVPGRPLAGLVGALALAAAVLSPVAADGASAASLPGGSAAVSLYDAVAPVGTASVGTHTEGPILYGDDDEGDGDGGDAAGRSSVGTQSSPVVWRSLSAAQFRTRWSGLLPARTAPQVDVPVTSPLTGPGSAASYIVFRNSDKTPVRFDPCTPVRVRINTPDSGQYRDAEEAVKRLAAATGIAFRVDGSTSFVPRQGATATPGVDLVIAWATPGSGGSDFLGGGQLGTGGWNTVGRSIDGKVHWRINNGFAILDSDKDRGLSPGFGTGLSRGALLLHELAHAVGVDHVVDPVQLMHPTLQHRTTPVVWGNGDLAALRLVGLPSGCIPR